MAYWATLVGFDLSNCLVSLRESSAFTLSITIIHMSVMTTLMVGAAITWAHTGMGVLRNNWELRPAGGANIARSIFNGVCIGFLGVTGFECTPAYIQNIKPHSYGPTLRNLLIMALFLNAPLMLFVYALLPSETILSGANVLSLLAEVTIGRPMRIVIVVDCLLGTSAPQTFLRTLPLTGTAYMPILLFFVMCLAVYGSSAFSLATVSTMFSASFLFTMLLYGVSGILLKFSRNRLPRKRKRRSKSSNIGLFVAYFAVVLLGMLFPISRLKIAHIALWILDQTKFIQPYRLDRSVGSWIKRFREDPVVLWVKDDHINCLVQAIIYIQRNELTSRVRLVHAYQNITTVPSELKANTRILDEAFPSITLDLVFIQGDFSPELVEAASQELNIPRGQMFMSCPGKDHPWQLGDYQGVRVIDF
ncbi:Amino acid permease [Rhizoctonia solani]|uniref:Amino acid permease n=1 Tax=Rhizoctonia solani TaxID=456999 RepID=A0A8H7M3W4_9AGAM|nr:Amino acid permease [Rhizoctonia solani]